MKLKALERTTADDRDYRDAVKLGVAGLIIVESPPAFRARLIFTRVEPLARARFPRDAPRAQVPLAWPPSAESAESPPGNRPE